MFDEWLLHPAQSLEWPGCELEFFGKKNNCEGSDASPPNSIALFRICSDVKMADSIPAMEKHVCGPVYLPVLETFCVVQMARPILLLACSTNQMAPSGPAAIPMGEALSVGTGNSVMFLPSVVMRPILLPPASVNHRAPSGPAAMPKGELLGVGMCSLRVRAPAVVRR